MNIPYPPLSPPAKEPTRILYPQEMDQIAEKVFGVGNNLSQIVPTAQDLFNFLYLMEKQRMFQPRLEDLFAKKVVPLTE